MGAGGMGGIEACEPYGVASGLLVFTVLATVILLGREYAELRSPAGSGGLGNANDSEGENGRTDMGVLPTPPVCMLSRWVTTRYCECPEPSLPIENRDASCGEAPAAATTSMRSVGAVPSARPTSAMGGKGGITKLPVTGVCEWSNVVAKLLRTLCTPALLGTSAEARLSASLSPYVCDVRLRVNHQFCRRSSRRARWRRRPMMRIARNMKITATITPTIMPVELCDLLTEPVEPFPVFEPSPPPLEPPELSLGTGSPLAPMDGELEDEPLVGDEALPLPLPVVGIPPALATPSGPPFPPSVPPEDPELERLIVEPGEPAVPVAVVPPGAEFVESGSLGVADPEGAGPLDDTGDEPTGLVGSPLDGDDSGELGVPPLGLDPGEDPPLGGLLPDVGGLLPDGAPLPPDEPPLPLGGVEAGGAADVGAAGGVGVGAGLVLAGWLFPPTRIVNRGSRMGIAGSGIGRLISEGSRGWTWVESTRERASSVCRFSMRMSRFETEKQRTVNTDERVWSV